MLQTKTAFFISVFFCSVGFVSVESGTAGSCGLSLRPQQNYGSARSVISQRWGGADPLRVRGGADQVKKEERGAGVLFGNETDFDNITPVQAMENMIGKEVVVGMEGGREMIGTLHAADENMNVVLHRPVEYWDRISGTLLHKEDADAFVRGNNVMHVGIRPSSPAGTAEGELK